MIGATRMTCEITSATVVSTGGRLLLFLRGLKTCSETLNLFFSQGLAGFREHLPFFFFDVMLDVFLEHSHLRGPDLVVLRQGIEFCQEFLDDAMFLNTLKGDVSGLVVFFPLWLEDHLFDLRVDVQLSLQLGEQLFAGFDSAFRGGV